MRALLLAAVCVLAVPVARCAANPLTRKHISVSLEVPSRPERRHAAKASGILPGNGALPLHQGPLQPQPAFAGQQSANLRIVNGENATLGQFPWMVGMFLDEGAFCGGSIISADWILTAGHCVDDVSKFVITVGSLSSSDGTEPSTQMLTSTESYLHPAYNKRFIDNDIGFVKPSSAFLFNEYVKPVRLPSHSMAADMMVGSTATISGWGKVDDGDDILADTLRYVDMVISDGSVCYDVYGSAWLYNKICFDTMKDKKSSCSGDSGGPLVIQEADGLYTQIGITSFGATSGCTIGRPVVFTRLASFLGFVQRVTNLEVRI